MTSPKHLVTNFKKATVQIVPHSQYIQNILELTKETPADIHDKVYELAKFIEKQNSSTFKQLNVKEGILPVFELCLESITLCELHNLGILSGKEEDDFLLNSVTITAYDGKRSNIGYEQGYAYNRPLV